MSTRSVTRWTSSLKKSTIPLQNSHLTKECSMIKNLIPAICCLSIFGCSSSSTSDNTDAVLTGVLIDSAVSGMNFTTATQSGITNTDGEFNYLENESVVFSLGAMEMPSVAAGESISPMELSQSSTDITTMAANIARLLQSLDIDADPSNGISIDSSAAGSAAPINFDVSADEFEQNTDVINLVANSGSTNINLVSADQANSHLYDTVAQSADGSLAGIAGFYNSSNPDLDTINYVVQRADGTSTAYNFDSEMDCYTTTEFLVEALGENRFRVTRPNDPTREPVERTFLRSPAAYLIARPDDESDRDDDGDITDTIYLSWPVVTNLSEGDLTVCS